MAWGTLSTPLRGLERPQRPPVPNDGMEGEWSASVGTASLGMGTEASGRRALPADAVTTPAYFPMYVVPVSEVLKFENLPVHEDLMERGLLEEVGEDCKCVHFISQRWLGSDHPDPEGVKLRRFQSVCRQIIDDDPRSLFEAADWEAFSTGASSVRTYVDLHKELNNDATRLEPDHFQGDVIDGYVWWDYMSVPQKLDADSQAMAARQKLAISSIPHYIERSAYFWVVVPEAVHTVTKEVVGYEDWQSRGWCRLEEWGNFLAVRVAPPLILTNAKHLGVVDTVDFMTLRCGIAGMAKHAACQGRFTCCDLGHQKKLPDGTVVPISCDKEEIARVLKRMFPNKVRHFKRTEKSIMYSLMRHAEYSVYAGSPLARKPANAEELLAKMGEGDVHGSDGLKPLVVAISYGCPELVREILEMRASPSPTDRNRPDASLQALFVAVQVGRMDIMELIIGTGLAKPMFKLGTPVANITAIDRAARAGHAEMCKLLLDGKSEVSPVRKDNGCTPLHTAAESGSAEVCKLLLAHGAEKDWGDLRGRTPLMLAAHRLSLFGKSQGKPACAKYLLEANANPYLSDHGNRVPAEVAEADNHQDFLAVYERWAEQQRREQSPYCMDMEQDAADGSSPCGKNSTACRRGIFGCNHYSCYFNFYC